MSTEVTVALIGISGVVVGSVLASAGQFALHWLQHGPRRRADKKREVLLRQMLEHPTYTWRNLDRLMHVIGSNEEETKQLLLGIEARASEDGSNKWGLQSRNPFRNEQ